MFSFCKRLTIEISAFADIIETEAPTVPPKKKGPKSKNTKDS